MNLNKTNRREMLKNTALAVGGLSVSPAFARLPHKTAKRKYHIGACDWSLGMRNEVAALERAREIGLDGVQISLGDTANKMHLRKKEVQYAYKEAVKKYGVAIGGIAIGELNSVPYATEAITDQWVSDSIDVAAEMGVKVVLIAFFGDGDINGKPDLMDIVTEKFMKVAPKAEAAGVVLGIESWMSADDHLKIINAVNSPNLKVYYDVANSEKMGYDIYEEIERLGKDMICEFHMKENGFKLGQGKVDFNKVRSLMEDMDYSGWMHLEGSRPEGTEIVPVYKENLAYLHTHFPRK
ncbi:MAG: sugar phosphate isomerase/epimerase [Cyclobacteriaceae bacterium]|nr:sugar phosphate isomerase/epimerase [Cyclobacteriaceae bacterium]